MLYMTCINNTVNIEVLFGPTATSVVISSSPSPQSCEDLRTWLRFTVPPPWLPFAVPFPRVLPAKTRTTMHSLRREGERGRAGGLPTNPVSCSFLHSGRAPRRNMGLPNEQQVSTCTSLTISPKRRARVWVSSQANPPGSTMGMHKDGGR